MRRDQDFPLSLTAGLIVAVAFAAMVLGLILAGSRPVRAHGDAEWIERGNYKNRIGELCCGVKDCDPVPDDQIVTTRDGFRIRSRNETVPYHEATPAPAEGGGRYWLCVWGGSRKCFFAPPGTN